MRVNTTPAVDAVTSMHLEGTLIPHVWFLHPRFEQDNGKPNLVAIILMADVVYWYRATFIKSEDSGVVTEVRKKFRADRLQKTYAQWAENFGFTKRQVQDAVAFLRERNLIDVEYRTIEVGGLKYPNVPYIEPVIPVLEEVSRYNVIPVTPERETCHVITGDVSRSNVTQIQYIPTETTPKITPPVSALASGEFSRESFEEDFNEFWSLYPAGHRGNKPNALKAYVAVRKKGISAEYLLEALRAWKASERWRRENGKYIKQAQGWLNGEMYGDTPVAKSKTQDVDGVIDGLAGRLHAEMERVASRYGGGSSE